MGRTLIISPEEIAAYFVKGDDRLHAYRFFMAMPDQKRAEWVQDEFGISAESVRRWKRGMAKPQVVKSVEFLEERGLIPFSLSNEHLPLVMYILGTTWHSGSLTKHGEGTNPVPRPDLHIGDEGRLEAIAKKLSLHFRQYPNKRGTAKRYTFSSEIGYLLAELGVPYGEGSKIDSTLVYPTVVDDLVAQNDQRSVQMFVATHLRTKAFPENGCLVVRTHSRRDHITAHAQRDAYVELYQMALPGIDIVSVKDYPYKNGNGPRIESRIRIRYTDAQKILKSVDTYLHKAV